MVESEDYNDHRFVAGHFAQEAALRLRPPARAKLIDLLTPEVDPEGSWALAKDMALGRTRPKEQCFEMISAYRRGLLIG